MTSLGEIAGRAIAKDKEWDKKEKSHKKKKELAKKIHGTKEYSGVSFTPRDKKEERAFNKRFNSKSA